MGDQGCGIKRHFITGQGEVETGCLASDSQICACRSFLSFLGQISSPAQFPRAPHASQLVRLFSSARRFFRSSNDRLLPLYLPLPLTFPLPLLLPLPLPLPLNRCHATIATASNCRASANASSASGSSPEFPNKAARSVSWISSSSVSFCSSS